MRSERPKNESPTYRAIDALLRTGLRLVPPSPLAEGIALSWGYRFKPAPRIVRLRSGSRIRVASIDHLQLLIYYTGVFEPASISLLKRCVAPGDTVVDIGANIGFYTLESSNLVGPAGRVIAVEALPDHAQAVRDNLALNGIDNVTLLEIAVGDQESSGVLTRRSGDNLGMFTLGNVEGTEACQVRIGVLDNILGEQNVERVDFIKMDIEGSEFRALQGAAKTMESKRPTVLLEINEQALQDCGSSAQALIALLESFGYGGWEITRQGLQALGSIANPGPSRECLFIHRDARELRQKLRVADR